MWKWNPPVRLCTGCFWFWFWLLSQLNHPHLSSPPWPRSPTDTFSIPLLPRGPPSGAAADWLPGSTSCWGFLPLTSFFFCFVFLKGAVHHPWKFIVGLVEKAEKQVSPRVEELYLTNSQQQLDSIHQIKKIRQQLHVNRLCFWCFVSCKNHDCKKLCCLAFYILLGHYYVIFFIHSLIYCQ